LTRISGFISVKQKTHLDSGQPVGYNILRSIYSISSEKLQNRTAEIPGTMSPEKLSSVTFPEPRILKWLLHISMVCTPLVTETNANGERSLLILLNTAKGWQR
jgi:hypothetical protein